MAIGASIALVVASSEPIYRERFPGHLSLPGLLSARGLRSKGFFRGLLLGYAMTAFFFAYQAVFYVVAARLGAWAPAEIPYDDILNTSLPWATVLFIGFLPAVLEEGSSRLFSISFLDRLGAGRIVAVVLPAFIWGFNHAAYPNQPFYIRGLEVGLAGVAIGFLMLRFGALPLLVWHFTVDALYTALLLLRSHNAYYVLTGGVSALILLLPLAISLLLYWRRGGFAPAAGLTNGDLGFVPAPLAPPPPAESVAPPRPVSGRALAVSGAVAVLLAAAFLVPADPNRRVVQDSTGRSGAAAIARDFLRANGVAPERYRQVVYPGTGFADDEDMREANPPETGAIATFSEGAARYVFSQGGAAGFRRLVEDRLPLDFWVVRCFEPEKKEEWKVLVDSRRSRVIGFVNPKEEAAPAAPPPSPEDAKRRALDAAGKLGYPAASYAVVDLGTQNRPKRVDTTVVLESRPSGVGQTWPRIRAVFHGARMASLLPTVRVPEDFQRAYRKRLAVSWLLVGVKVVAIGGVVGVGFLIFLRLVRAPGFRWRTHLLALAIVAPLAAVGVGNSFPGRVSRLPDPDSARGLRVHGRIDSPDRPRPAPLRPRGRLRALLGRPPRVAAGETLRLAPGRRPQGRGGGARSGRPRALGGSRGGAFPRGLLLRSFAARFSPDRLPGRRRAVERRAGAPSRSRPLRLSWRWRCRIPCSGSRSDGWLAVLAVFFALVPASFHSMPEFLASFVPPLLMLASLTAAAFWLLKDHVAAWVLFGVLTFGGRAAAALLVQPARADRFSGWMGLLLVLLAAAALLAGRRSGEPADSFEAPPPREV